MCGQVCDRVLPTYSATDHSEGAAQPLSRLPDDGTYDVLKHVTDLITPDVCTFWCK